MPFVPTSITCIDWDGEPDPNARFLIATDEGHVLVCGAEWAENDPDCSFVLDPAYWPTEVREADTAILASSVIPPLDEAPVKAIVQSDMRTGRPVKVKVERILTVEKGCSSTAIRVSLGKITGFTVPAPAEYAPTA